MHLVPDTSQTDCKLGGHAHDRYLMRLKDISQRHRKVEAYGVIAEQFSQGRPDLGWSPCGNPQCSSDTCLLAPFHLWTMFFKRVAKDGKSGTDYIWQTIDQLGNVLWPGARTCEDKMVRHMILGSFFHSPPVRSAYFLLRAGAANARLLADRKSIQQAICQASPFIESIISKEDLSESHDIICWYLGPSFSRKRDQRTLADCVVRAMLLCETWRRYPSDRSKAWNFGPPSVICDLYGGIMLAMRTLELWNLASRVPMVHTDVSNKIWGQWLQAYPLCAVIENPYVGGDFIPRSACRPDRREDVPGLNEETVLEEVGYLGAVGTYTPMVHRKVTRRGADARFRFERSR